MELTVSWVSLVRMGTEQTPPVPPGVPDPGGAEAAASADGAVLAVVGCLDGEAGLHLMADVKRALAAGAGRIDVELCAVTDFTQAGTAALAACRQLAARAGDHPAGVEVHYRTNRGPGRDAMLAAFAQVQDDADGAGSDVSEAGDPLPASGPRSR
jgi:hypothetical protein